MSRPLVRRRLIRFTILALVIVLVGLGLGRIRAYVNRLPRHQVLPAHVSFVESAPWLSETERRSIVKAAVIERRFGIFDPDLQSTVTEAWSRSPLVRRVIDVHALYPNRVRVTLEVRRPVAAVVDRHDSSTLVLVDREGVRWPGRFRTIPPRFGDRILLIQGVETDPPRPGDVWRDRKLIEGVAVAVDLRRQMPDSLAKRTRIAVVDVASVGTKEAHSPEIVLRTHQGREILWGRSSASPSAAAELSVASKIAHIVRAEEAYPYFNDLAYLGVYSDKLFVRIASDP